MARQGLTRRSLLQAATAAVPVGAAVTTTTMATMATMATMTSCAAPLAPREVEPAHELASFLVDSEPEALLRGCIARVEGGMSAQRIATATAVASARSFSPSAPDANLHVLYATDAAFALGIDAPCRETLDPSARLFTDPDPPAVVTL